jgi:nucleoside-diphosphate-sugar epimerase
MQEKNMSDVLVTGGTGFVGHWLSTVPGMQRRTVYMGRKAYENNMLGVVDWEYIIHLAPVPVDRAIEQAKLFGSTILLASSGGVYDREPSEYFRMKQEDEKKLSESGVKYRIARIFTTCGAHMKWARYAIGNFIMQAEKGQIEVQSHGLVVRSYMYGSDLAEWLWAILLHGVDGGVYNVGSDIPHSTAELAFEVANHFEPRPGVTIVPRMQYEPRPFYVPMDWQQETQNSKALGLTIKVPFEEAVRLTVEDYRNEQHR